MHIARPATVMVILAFREERAKHAVLHVKHGHVLVNGHLEPSRRRALNQRLQLREIQIIARGQTFQLEFVYEIMIFFTPSGGRSPKIGPFDPKILIILKMVILRPGS